MKTKAHYKINMCCHTVKVSVSVFRQFTGKKVQSTEQKYPAWYNGQLWVIQELAALEISDKLKGTLM